MGLVVDATRPFIYFLYDQPTGAILFMGRVQDPNQHLQARGKVRCGVAILLT